MTSRKYFVMAWAIAVVLIGLCRGDIGVLPTGSSPRAIEFQHFPDRLHAFVWRNWEMVSLERMAEVLGTTPEKIRETGESMGLPPHKQPPTEYQQQATSPSSDGTGIFCPTSNY
jgi:hypothetical protein